MGLTGLYNGRHSVSHCPVGRFMSSTDTQPTVYAFVVITLALLAVGQTSLLYAEGPAGSRDEIQPVVDSFQGTMSKEWRWLRENKDGWKLTDSGLQVLIEPGNMWGKANSANNVLLHSVPDTWRDSVEISVQMEQHPKKRWEQTNLVWYYSDSTMVKIGLEIENGRNNIVMGREIDDRTETIAIIPYPEETVQLKLVVDGCELTGFYRNPASKAWTEVGQTSLPFDSSTPPQVSLQFYQGEVDANRWATVSHFKMQGR